MSKRLEDIEERVIYGADSEDAKVDVWVELRDYEYLKEQAERVQELEKLQSDSKMHLHSTIHNLRIKLEGLERENKRYHEAYKFFKEAVEGEKYIDHSHKAQEVVAVPVLKEVESVFELESDAE